MEKALVAREDTLIRALNYAKVESASHIAPLLLRGGRLSKSSPVQSGLYPWLGEVSPECGQDEAPPGFVEKGRARCKIRSSLLNITS
jgi:hypothetical protein